MGKLSKNDMEELREILSLGCDYSGTKEEISVLVYQTLEKMGSIDIRRADEIGLFDDKEFATLDDFIEIFWEKAVEEILNVVETQGDDESEEWKNLNEVTVGALIRRLQQEDNDAVVINCIEENIRVYSGRENEPGGRAVVMIC